jgi:hypothetical protein
MLDFSQISKLSLFIKHQDVALAGFVNPYIWYKITSIGCII